MRTLLFFFLTFGAFVSAEAQQVASYFAAMPVELLPQIDVNRRKDMIDLFRESRQSRISNSLGGQSEITALSSDYLSLTLSSASTLQMKLLPWRVGAGQVIAVVHTVCAPACDSRIDFYDTDWNLLNRERCFPMPEDADFLLAEFTNDESAAEAIRKIDISLMRYDFGAENNDLRITSTLAEYMPKEEYGVLQPFLKKSLVYRWDGIRFSLEKP